MVSHFVDIPKLVRDIMSAGLSGSGVAVYRKVPSNAAELTPFTVYAVSSPTRVSNAAFRHGAKFTLVFSVIAADYPSVMKAADTVLHRALNMGSVSHPLGKLTHMEVVTGIEDTTTTLSSKDLEQVSMVLSGIARKE